MEACSAASLAVAWQPDYSTQQKGLSSTPPPLGAISRHLIVLNVVLQLLNKCEYFTMAMLSSFDHLHCLVSQTIQSAISLPSPVLAVVAGWSSYGASMAELK